LKLLRRKARQLLNPKKIGATKKVATHPTANVMVIEAVTALADRKGSTLQVIKKHISGADHVDIERLGSFIRKALVKKVEEGKLTQTKGSTGTSRSFKLTVKSKPAKELAAGDKKASKSTSPTKSTAAEKSKKAKEPAVPKKSKIAAPAKPSDEKKVKRAPAATKHKSTKAKAPADTPVQPKTEEWDAAMSDPEI
jgi:histone H1/5